MATERRDPFDSQGSLRTSLWGSGWADPESSIGPFFGQAGYFRNRAPEPVPAAIEKFSREVERLYGVVDRRLAEVDFLAGEYSIADIACFPWMWIYPRFGVEIEAFPNVVRWLGVINARPAVQRGLDLL